MGRRSKTLFALAVMVFALIFALPFSAFADQDHKASQTTKKTQTVKVGYTLMPGFQDGAEGEYKSGQGYEYLQKIASYAGWEYEYVYGDFDTLFKKLQSGEIDLMGNISYTKARAKTISYGSHEQGRDSFYLYTTGNDSAINSEDLSTLNGKKIGALTGTYQIELWNSWCAKNNINCQLVEYRQLDKGQDALNNGDVDGFLGVVMPTAKSSTANWHIALSYGDAPYYFAVSKSKPQLLKQLNAAQASILNSNPYYNEELIARYASSGAQTRSQLSVTEETWLSRHKDQPLKVGLLNNTQPLANQDDQGNITGVIPDLLNAIQETYSAEGLQFQMVMYSDYQQIVSDLNNGTIDIAAPVYNDPYNAEKEETSLTNSFLTTTMLQLFENGHAGDKVKTLAIDNGSPVQKIYAQLYYPDCKLVAYNSAAETAKAIQRGEVDAALSTACCYHVNAILHDEIGNLGRSTLPNKVDLCMAVSRSNPALMSLLNRGIAATSEAVVNDSLTVNSSVTSRVTLMAFISANPVPTTIACVALIAFLLLIIIRLRRANRLARTDAMTGLLNKVAMHEHVKNQIAHGGVLFVIDIDDFKDINDTQGHQDGDQVISYFAQELQTIFRSGDLIARFGGDEFTVFMPVASVEECTIAKKVDLMQAALAKCPVIQNSNGILPGTVSVGVLVMKPHSSLTYLQAFKKADDALYQAKQSGKCTYVIAAE